MPLFFYLTDSFATTVDISIIQSNAENFCFKGLYTLHF